MPPAAYNPEIHLHDEVLEGPLPPGFPLEGRQGKVRNVYIDDERACLIASDRVSAFDQVSPTPIPGKGKILNGIAARELQAAEASGIATWFEYVPAENPRAAVGRRADVLLAEIIFRNYMVGGMAREYLRTGDVAGMGLPGGWKEWEDFTAEPLFTPSTKAAKDVYFDPARSEAVTGIDRATFKRMEGIGRKLFELGTARAARRGLILVDTKYEMGVTHSGDLVIIDEVHTPDSSRFVMADGFRKTIKRGGQPENLSKEFLRGIMLQRAGGDEALAKELMKEPLPAEVADEILRKYQRLHAIFTAD